MDRIVTLVPRFVSKDDHKLISIENQLLLGGILLALMVHLSALSSPLFAKDIGDREIGWAILKNLISDFEKQFCWFWAVPITSFKDLWGRLGKVGKKEGELFC